MIDDLIENHLKIGMNKSDVEKILVKSDYGPSQYYLGVISLNEIDPSFLFIEYDKINNIETVGIVTKGKIKIQKLSVNRKFKHR